MFLKTWFNGDMLYFEKSEFDDSPFPHHWIQLDTEIEKIEQHNRTVYVKGKQANFIVVNLGFPDSIEVLHEYSHKIPTWMKEDFNRFLNE